jgi:polyisoprenoid-binding protein YceI
MRRRRRSLRIPSASAAQAGGVVTTILVIAVILVAGLGAFWFLFIRSDADPPPELSTSATVPGGTLDGTWHIRPDWPLGTFVQYRVQERFAGALESEATGRTSAISGTMRIEGSTVRTARIEAEMNTLESDKVRRDEALQTSGIETDRFPTATFELTEPLDLGSPEKGATIDADVTGDLTLHGVTRTVTVPVEGRWDGETVQVVGQIPIEFADYDITPPSVGGFVTVADKGAMELQLVFLKR